MFFRKTICKIFSHNYKFLSSTHQFKNYFIELYYCKRCNNIHQKTVIYMNFKH
jgi:hypothetical protein